MTPTIRIPKTRQLMDAIRREGVTVTAMAQRCGVSRSTFYRYMEKPGTMPVSVWVTVMDELNLNQDPQ
jgi:predicted DNA-binding transcriptional regulator AlpA